VTVTSTTTPTPAAQERPANPVRLVFVILAVGLALVTIGWGCASVVAALGIRTYHSTTSFPITDDLVIRGGDGSITLIADATDEIVVDATVRHGLGGAHPVASEQTDGLVLDGGCTSVFNTFCSVTFTVHVPRHLNLRGSVGDGSLTARGLVGTVAFSVGDGRVDLQEMDADSVDLSAGDGSIHVGLVSAPQSIHVVTGDGSGSVCLPSSTPSYAVILHKGDGSIHVDVPNDSRSSRTMALSTGDGSISARLCP